MNTLWEFSINEEIVDEPIGWDKVAITVQRDEAFHGLENIISDGLKFWGEGADIIKTEYELNGIDGELDFLIRYSCDNGDNYTTLFTGTLNCFFYSRENSEVSIKAEPSGFHRILKNRLDTPVNLNSNVSIDGQAMSSIAPFDLLLHGKHIEFKGNFILNNASNTYTSAPNDTHAINLPFLLQASDVPDLQEVSAFVPVESILTNSSGQTRTIRVKLHVICTHFATVDTDAHVIINYSGGFQLVINGVVYYTAPQMETGTPQSFDFTIDETVTIGAGLGLEIYLFDQYANIIYAPLISYDGEYVFDSSSTMEIFDISSFTPSTTKAFLVFEAFAKLCESITGEVDCFRSDYFGRVNSDPFSYSQNGCGGWLAISNGLNIRQMVSQSGDYFPIVTTFNQLYDAIDSVLGIGMRIEKDSSGKEYVRIEPKEFFYNGNATLTTLQVSDLKITPAQDLIFNNFKIGYSKFSLNISGVNGLDEFNSERSYVIPVKNANKPLQKICNFIASGYLIEQTRRIQYQTNPTTDFELDNDNFLICTNREEITSDLYSNPPLSSTYPAGKVSERDENFSNVDNLISPETAYNLRISPARMALNWYKYICPSIFKHPTESINFVSGKGNYEMESTMINDCVISADVVESQNLLASQLTGVSGYALFLPENLEYTYPLSYEDFLIILENTQNAIQLSCSDASQYIGFIRNLKYEPTSEGGIASFRLLRGLCIPGDFNNDFNNDFLVGTC